MTNNDLQNSMYKQSNPTIKDINWGAPQHKRNIMCNDTSHTILFLHTTSMFDYFLYYFKK